MTSKRERERSGTCFDPRDAKCSTRMVPERGWSGDSELYPFVPQVAERVSASRDSLRLELWPRWLGCSPSSSMASTMHRLAITPGASIRPERTTYEGQGHRGRHVLRRAGEGKGHPCRGRPEDLGFFSPGRASGVPWWGAALRGGGHSTSIPSPATPSSPWRSSTSSPDGAPPASRASSMTRTTRSSTTSAPSQSWCRRGTC